VPAHVVVQPWMQHSLDPPFSVRPIGPQVQRDFEELPQDAVISLRESLMALLIKYAK
jgi:hypothetical protein